MTTYLAFAVLLALAVRIGWVHGQLRREHDRAVKAEAMSNAWRATAQEQTRLADEQAARARLAEAEARRWERASGEWEATCLDAQGLANSTIELAAAWGMENRKYRPPEYGRN